MIRFALRHCRLAFDAAVPVRCAACGAHGDQVCLACVRSLTWAPLLFRAAQNDVPPVLALGPHQGQLRTAVLNVKFRNRMKAAEILGAILGDRLGETGDLIVPVPLHARRRAERGFNQAEAIARGVAQATGGTVREVLVRLRQTDTQTSLALTERRANVSDAFAPAPGTHSLRGRRVLVVDDVVTTGATLAACATVLRRAGVADVRAAALAIKL